MSTLHLHAEHDPVNDKVTCLVCCMLWMGCSLHLSYPYQCTKCINPPRTNFLSLLLMSVIQMPLLVSLVLPLIALMLLGLVLFDPLSRMPDVNCLRPSLTWLSCKERERTVSTWVQWVWGFVESCNSINTTEYSLFTNQWLCAAFHMIQRVGSQGWTDQRMHCNGKKGCLVCRLPA